MFQSSRPNSTIYILHKDLNPWVEEGSIVSVSPPRFVPPKPGEMPPSYQHPMPQVVDIVVRTAKDNVSLTGLPANEDITDYNNMVVSTSKDYINNEIKAMRQQSENIVNGYERNKELISIYDNILMSLNPEEAEKKRQDMKIREMENAIKSQNEINQQLLAQLQALTSQNKLLNDKLDGLGNSPKKSKENA